MAKVRNKRYFFILENLLKLGVKKKSFIIDCACGDGYGSSVLQSSGMSVVGFDISNKLVSAAIDRGVKAHVANICDIPISDNVVDVFVCSETLEHLDKKELKKAVREMKRITSDNGIICITVPVDRKICLDNKNHKQYLSDRDLENIFNGYDIILNEKFCKKIGRCNTVMFFRK